jgi:hypothetical protein
VVQRLVGAAVSVAVIIAHAAWAPKRIESLDRLATRLEREPVISTSEQKEHASTWARRAWEIGLNEATDHAVFLNDDVTVPKRFERICELLTTLLPDDVISLHATAPEAATHRGRWLRAYQLTGPGYILPTRRIPDLLACADRFAPLWETDNEDGMVMQWLWQEQTPAYQCIPALAQHDTTVPSTLGYDDHKLRTTKVAWTEFPDIDLLDEAGWRQGLSDAPLVECPWRSQRQLRANQRRGGRPVACAACDARAASGRQVVEFQNGGGICLQCLAQACAMAIVRA